MGVVTNDVYPDVSGLATAFVGFAGGNEGRQDCAHIAAAGILATCVDNHMGRLDGMPALYPDRWAFLVRDVYNEAALRVAAGERFDLVSLDPYTNQMQECADRLDLWTQLATKKIVMGTVRDTWLPLDLDGWQIADTIQRSTFNGGVYWTVLETT